MQPEEKKKKEPEKKEQKEEKEIKVAEEKDYESLLKEEKEKLLRTLADFDNFKKRTAVEREEIVKFANEVFIVELLPIIDGFERSLKAAQEGGNLEDLTKGIALIKKQLEDSLKKLKVEPIKALGEEYNPHLHEAVMQKEVEGKKENIIVEEMHKGYTFHGKVIRPSMVIVSK